MGAWGPRDISVKGLKRFVLWLGWGRSKEVGAHIGLGSMTECFNKPNCKER